MKIGIVSFWFERGAAYGSRQYRDTLKAAGHEVFVFARGGEKYAVGDSRWDGPEVHWSKRSWRTDAFGMDPSDFKKWLEKTEVSAVLFNEQRTLWPVSLCSRLGIKTIAYIDYYTKETVPTFSIYDALICNTHRHASVFAWHPQCLYIPWGTDTDLFHPSPSWPEPVVPGVVTFFLSSGYSPTRKGVDLAVRAFSRVTSPARLIIHEQKDLLRELPDLAPILDAEIVKGRIEILHKTIPAPGGYHLGDVYLYPSRLDGIGLTVCEALACGLPVIVPDEPPMNEFVDGNGKVGFRVPVVKRFVRSDGYYWPMCELDVEQLSRVMESLACHPERLSVLKCNARTHAVSDRSWKTNATALPGWINHLEYTHDNRVCKRFRRRKIRDLCKDVCHNLKQYCVGGRSQGHE